MSKLNIGRIPIMKGEFVVGKTYNRLWQVTYLGSTYQSKIDNNTSSPAEEVNGVIVHKNTDKWLCIADATKAVNSAKGLSDEISRATSAENSIQTQVTNNKKDIDSHQEQITSNDEDIAALQNKTTQIKETVDSIAVSGGASVASSVTYDSTASGLNVENVQQAVDNLQSDKFDKENIVQESGNSTDKVMSQAAVNNSRIVPNTQKIFSLMGEEQANQSVIPGWSLSYSVFPCAFDGIYLQAYKVYSSNNILMVLKKDGSTQMYSGAQLGLQRDGYIYKGYVKFQEDWSYFRPIGYNYPQKDRVGYKKENEYFKIPTVNKNIYQAPQELLEMAENYTGDLIDGYVVYGLNDSVIQQGGHNKHYKIDCDDIDKFVLQKKANSTIYAVLLKFYDEDGNELYDDSIYDASCFTGAAVVDVPQNAKTAIYNYSSDIILQVVRKNANTVFVTSADDLTAETSKGKTLILVKDISVSQAATTIAEGATIVFGTHSIIITIPNLESLCSPATDETMLDKVITLDYDREINPKPIYRTSGSYGCILTGLFQTKDKKVYLSDLAYCKQDDSYQKCFWLFENFIAHEFVIDRVLTMNAYTINSFRSTPPVATSGLSKGCTLTFTNEGFYGEDIAEGDSIEGYQHQVLPITGSITIKNGRFGKYTLAICNPAGEDHIRVKFENCYFNNVQIVAGPCFGIAPKKISLEVDNCEFVGRLCNITCFAVENARIVNNVFKNCARPINGTYANSEFAYNRFENANDKMITGMIFGGACFGTPNAWDLFTADAAKESEYFGCELFNCNIHNNVFRDVLEEAVSIDTNCETTTSSSMSTYQQDICYNRNLMVVDEIISSEWTGNYAHTRYQCARVHFVYEDKFIEYYDKHFSFVPLGNAYFGAHTFIKKIEKDPDNDGKYLIYSESDQFFQYYKAGELFAILRCHVNNWIHNNIFYQPRSAAVCLYNIGINEIVENNEIYSKAGQMIWAQAHFNGRYSSDGTLKSVIKRILISPTIGMIIRNNICHGSCITRVCDTGTTDYTKVVSEDYPIYMADGAESDYSITTHNTAKCIFEGNIGFNIVDECGKGTIIRNNPNSDARTNKPATDTYIEGMSSNLYLMGNNQFVKFAEASQLKQWSDSDENTPTFKKGSTKFEDGVLKYFDGTEWK